jgi:hypothetical protein
LIEARIDSLPHAARRLLQTRSIAGQPLSLAASIAASGSTQHDVRTLRAVNLLRGIDSQRRKLLECYPDRVRETVIESTSENGGSRSFVDSRSRSTPLL